MTMKHSALGIIRQSSLPDIFTAFVHLKAKFLYLKHLFSPPVEDNLPIAGYIPLKAQTRPRKET